jgi:hypothetical protein
VQAKAYGNSLMKSWEHLLQEIEPYMTIHHNGQIVEKGTWADVKFRGLAERKCAF